jgi:hypothetical protein
MIVDGDGVILVGEIALMLIGWGDQIFSPKHWGSKQDLMMSGMDSSSELPNKLKDLADEMDFRLPNPGGEPILNFIGGDSIVKVFAENGVGTLSLTLDCVFSGRDGCGEAELFNVNCFECKVFMKGNGRVGERKAEC